MHCAGLKWRTKDAQTEIVKSEFFCCRADTSEQTYSERRKRIFRESRKSESCFPFEKKTIQEKPQPVSSKTLGKESGNGGCRAHL